ncbi:efflux transporter outer membrane subunit [Sphaerochaeta sp.]|uniref:efflux transporter outer membrane subunit n=1 Tax=Sphaerochaeta sp. TaxID=1972642 RepID=UPI003D112733
MKRTAIKLSVFTLSVLLFAGCTGYRGLNTESEIDKIPLVGVQTEKGDWPDEKWWEKLNDPQLNELVEDALAGNPSLSEAQARIRQAQAAAGIADSANSVQVNGDAASTYQRFPRHETYPSQHAGRKDTVNRLQITAGYDFDLWGKNKADYEAALGGVRIAEVDGEAAKLTLVSALVLDYVRLDSAYRNEDLKKEMLDRYAQIIDLQKKRYDAGLDSQQNINVTESAMHSVSADIKKLQEEQTLLKISLGTMTGIGTERGLKLNRPALGEYASACLPEDLPAELIGRRPDIAAQKWRIEAMQQRIKSAKTEFYPNVNLNAFAGFRSIGLENLLRTGSGTFGIGPAVSLPIFNGGALRSGLAMKNAQYDEAVERYNTLILNAVQEVADLAVSGRENMKQLEDRQNAVGSLINAKKLSDLNYKSGIASALPALNTEIDILNAKSAVIALKSRQTEIAVSMTRALGGGAETGIKNGEEKKNNE